MRLVALLVLLASAAASAQPAAPRPAVSSLSVGIGNAARPEPRVGVSGGPLLTASLDYQRSVGTLLAQVGVSGSSELFGGDELNEVHVAVGGAGSAGPLLLSAVAGPSVGGARVAGSGGSGPRSTPVVGAYIAARGIFVVVPRVGVGVEAFAHANTVLPVAGGRLVFAFGRLPGAAFPNPPPTPRRPGP